MQVPVLNHKQIVALIKAVGPTRTVIVAGENGCGKTSVQYDLRQDPDFANHIVADPIDCTQLSDGSVWMPSLNMELGVSCELPNERFGVNVKNRRGIDGSTPSIICLDEIMKAPQYIKNVLAPIIYERRVGNYHLPEGSIVWGATNLGIEGLGDELKAHLRNRLVFVKMRKPTQPEWKNDFAIPRSLHGVVTAFTEQHPEVFDSFLDYEQDGKNAGKDLSKDNPYIFNPRAVQEAYASPRSLHAASDIMYASQDLDHDTLIAALAGACGEPTARELSMLYRLDLQVATLDRVVADPEGAPLSDNPTAQLVQVYQFLSRVKEREQAAAVVKYVRRMRNEMQTLFCNDVANSSRMGLFATVAEFQPMLKDNKLFLNVK